MRCLAILTVAFFATLQVYGHEPAKDEQQPERQRVGLVLSGGGAKGMAHIGVLKVLERAGVPIDYITGTSMGSIVGGLYACGNTPEKLDSVVRAQDWAFVLSDREDLRHQSLKDREKQSTYLFSRAIDIGKVKESSAGGFVQGKNIMNLFEMLCTPYNDSIDFNKLPIPFACVATNIIDNTEYDYHSGILSRAMRASMSIPGVFSPLKVDDMVLVDGGLRNNFPADLVREMGADIIIGVSVQGEPKKANQINTTTDVISQIVDVNCKNKYDDNVAMTDIVVKVNTTGYSAASFTKVAIDTLIRRGEEAAMQHWDEFVALAKQLGPVEGRPNAKASDIASNLVTKGRVKIEEIVFENMTKADENFISKKFKLKVGDSIDVEKAEIITTSMRTDLFYKTANYRLLSNEDHSAVRAIFVAGERKVSEVNIGMRFDTEEEVAIQANVDVPLMSKIPMDVDMTLRLGQRIMAGVDWSWHPRSFFRPKVSYVFHHNNLDVYEQGDKAFSMTYNQHTLNLDLFNFNIRNFSFNIGGTGDYYYFHSVLGDIEEEDLKDVDVKDKGYISYYANVDYNSENNWYFPTRGTRFTARFAYYTDNFYNLKDEVGLREYSAMWRMSFPFGKYLTLQPMLYGRLLYGENLPLMYSNVMGGPWFSHYLPQQMPFAGAGSLQMVPPKIVAAQLQCQLTPTLNNVILFKATACQGTDDIEDLMKHSTRLGVAASYYYKTFFGPLGATIGYSTLTKKAHFYINCGYVF